MDVTMLETVIARAAQTENTPELGRYWKEKYQEIIRQKLFILHPETAELATGLLVEKPVTSLGDIVLQNHIKDDNALDEKKLASTIEIAVRLLDAILEIIPFSASAGHIVKSYRKIGLGVADLSDYLEKNTTHSQLENIDIIGEIISTSAYRASEMLALEKGSCTNWQIIAYHLRPKLFEIWQHEQSKAERNGLEMSEQYTAENIVDSGYAIKPRRNSNLLMLPMDSQWHIWSDRDQTAAPTPISQQPAAPQQVKPSSQPINILENVSTPKIMEADTQVQPHYQIGELVVVQTEAVPEYEKVYQVIDIHHSEDGKIWYELTGGNSELEEKRWLQEELNPVDLTDILHKVNENEKKNEAESQVQILAHPLLLNPEADSVLVIKKGEKIDLPGFSIGKNQVPERVVSIQMRDEYGIELQNITDVGSSTSHTNTFGPSTLHLGFAATASYTTHPDFGWFKLNKLDILPMYIQTLIRKRNKNTEELSQKDAKISQLQSQLETANKTLQNQKSEVHLEGDGNVVHALPILQDSKTQIYPSKSNKADDSVIYTSHFHIIHSMSKYALKLEQLVQTTKFGDVAVNLQYDNEGAKVVTAQGQKVAPELQQQLDVVLGLVNFCLAKKIAPVEIATQLEKDPQGEKVDLNDIVKVIAASLKEAPENADKINGGMLGHIAVEAVSDVMNAVKEGRPVQQATQEQKAEEPKPQQPSMSGMLGQNRPEQPAQSRPQQQQTPQPMQQNSANQPANEASAKPSFNPFARK